MLIWSIRLWNILYQDRLHWIEKPRCWARTPNDWYFLNITQWYFYIWFAGEPCDISIVYCCRVEGRRRYVTNVESGGSNSRPMILPTLENTPESLVTPKHEIKPLSFDIRTYYRLYLYQKFNQVLSGTESRN